MIPRNGWKLQRVDLEYQKLTKTLADINREQRKQDGNAFGGLFAQFVGVQTAANLATGAIQSLGRSLVGIAQSGVEMETLTLQLEAFGARRMPIRLC